MPESTGNGQSTSAARSASTPDVQAMLRALSETSVFLARAQFARDHGITFGGLRDEYKVFGYEPVITTRQYRLEYHRGGIAGRVVDVMPDYCWRGDPAMRLIDDDDPDKDTEFEQAWNTLEKQHQICARFWRGDKLSRLSTYAVLLIGAKGELETPLPQADKRGLLYLKPYLGGGGPSTNLTDVRTGPAYDSGSITILEFEDDPQNERYGEPRFYQLRERGSVTRADTLPKVHWSRVTHIAEGCLEDEVYGLPALERIFNLLVDLRKLTGGGSEAFFLRANQGLHLDVDKDMALESTKDTIDALKEQAEAYQHQLTRWLRTRGVKVETLGSDTASFAKDVDAIVTQIAGATGIPKRILTGSEMGELASTQDRENFRDLITGRQMQHCAPNIIRPLADRLIKFGYLPQPQQGEYKVEWSHIEVKTDDEKAKGAKAWMETNQAAKNAGLRPVFTEAETRDYWYGMAPMTDEQLAEIEDAKRAAMELAQEMAPEPVAPARPQLRAAERNSPLHRAASAYEDIFEREVRKAFRAGRAAVDKDLLRKALTSRENLGEIVMPAATAVAASLRTSLLPLLLKTLRAGGEAGARKLGQLKTAEELRAAKEPRSTRIQFRFDALDPNAVEWADRHAAELVTRVSETTRQDINNAIAELLESGDWDAAYEELLDAVGSEERATLIARHETMTAASEGQRLAWAQAKEQGLLSGREKRTWITTPDDRLCPICDGLEGKRADLDGTYTGSDGEVYAGPPAHVACRCTEGLA